MNLYDINGAIISNGSDVNAPIGEVSATVKQEEIDLLSSYSFFDGNRLDAKGESFTFANWSVSEYIPCTAGEKIRFEFTITNLTPAFWCYDSGKNAIGYVSGSLSVVGVSQELTTLDDTAYIRFSLGTGNDVVKAFVSRDVTYYSFADTVQKRWQINVDESAQNTRLAGLDALLHNYTKWNGKSLVTDGNSLVDACDWGTDLAEILGMTHTNCGVSGSMIVPFNWTMEDIKANVNDDYPDTVDLVMLQGDTNGAMDGDPSDQMDGDNPKTTWMARMNYFIRCIKARFHNVVIVLMPDSVRYDGYREVYEVGSNHTSYTSMKALAEYNRLAFFAFDHSTPWNPNDDNYYSRLTPGSPHTTQDSVHPFEPYNVAKGRALAHWVAGLVFDPNAPNTAATNWQDTV